MELLYVSVAPYDCTGSRYAALVRKQAFLDAWLSHVSTASDGLKPNSCWISDRLVVHAALELRPGMTLPATGAGSQL